MKKEYKILFGLFTYVPWEYKSRKQKKWFLVNCALTIITVSISIYIIAIGRQKLGLALVASKLVLEYIKWNYLPRMMDWFWKSVKRFF